MSKNFKKLLKSELAKIDARINVLEANLSRLVLAAIEAMAPQILEVEEEKPAKKKRRKESKEVAEQKESKAVAPEKVAEPTPVVETPKKTRKPRTTKPKTTENTVETTTEKKPRGRRPAEKTEPELPADDLCHLEGIGAVYADKLKIQSIHNLQDMANISDARIDEIEVVIKGFKKRMESNDWRGQAVNLLKK